MKKRGPRWYPSKQSMCVSYQHDARLYRRLYLLQDGGERGGGEQTAFGDEFKFVVPELESPFDGGKFYCIRIRFHYGFVCYYLYFR